MWTELNKWTYWLLLLLLVLVVMVVVVNHTLSRLVHKNLKFKHRSIRKQKGLLKNLVYEKVFSSQVCLFVCFPVELCEVRGLHGALCGVGHATLSMRTHSPRAELQLIWGSSSSSSWLQLLTGPFIDVVIVPLIPSFPTPISTHHVSLWPFWTTLRKFKKFTPDYPPVTQVSHGLERQVSWQKQDHVVVWESKVWRTLLVVVLLLLLSTPMNSSQVFLTWWPKRWKSSIPLPSILRWLNSFWSESRWSLRVPHDLPRPVTPFSRKSRKVDSWKVRGREKSGTKVSHRCCMADNFLNSPYWEFLTVSLMIFTLRFGVTERNWRVY